MATSPFVSPPLARAGGAVSRRLAPTAPAPTAAPFSRNERRSVTCQGCSTFSMVFSFGSSGERQAAPLAVVRTPRCGVAEPPQQRCATARYGWPISGESFVISSSGGTEALGADRGRIVPKLHEQVVSSLYERRWTADEDARPRFRCRPYGTEHRCVDAPREPGPADRRLAGERAMQNDSVGCREGFELVAIQGVVKRAGGNEQPRIDFARARSTMAEHRHHRNKTRSAADQEQRTVVVGSPREVPADRPAQLELVAEAKLAREGGGNLPLVDPLYRQRETLVLRGGPDRI